MKVSLAKDCQLKTTTKGMSFVEVIVWIGILTLLMAAMVVAIINVYKGNSYIFERAIAVLSARKGLESATKLVREAQYSDSGGYPIVALSGNSLTFFVDYDNDDSVEQVRLFLDGESLRIGVVEPTGSPAEYIGSEVVKQIVNNVRNTTLGRDLFTYYDDSGVEVVNMSALLEPVFVSVDLITNTGKNPTVNDYELQGSAYIRNLKN